MHEYLMACTNSNLQIPPVIALYNAVDFRLFGAATDEEECYEQIVGDLCLPEMHSLKLMQTTSFFASVMPETFEIAARLFIRCTAKNSSAFPLTCINSNWIGATCLMIACKYLEATCPTLEALFAFLIDDHTIGPGKLFFLDTVTRLKIATIEVRILRAVDYRVRWINHQ
jgi:hypothetical protein